MYEGQELDHKANRLAIRYEIQSHWKPLVHAAGIDDEETFQPENYFMAAKLVMDDPVVRKRTLERAVNGVIPLGTSTQVVLDMTPRERKELKERLLARNV